MKTVQFLLLLFSLTFSSQNTLPLLNFSKDNFKHFEDYQKDVKKLLNLKQDEICVSFYTTGGLAYSLNIDNFIFKRNEKIVHYREKVFYKYGKKHRKNKIPITKEKNKQLWDVIQSEFFINFSEYSQSNFKFSENTHQICSKTSIGDAPENYIMISQNNKQTIIMVYLPLNNLKCSKENSPLMNFVKLHKLFDVEIER